MITIASHCSTNYRKLLNQRTFSSQLQQIYWNKFTLHYSVHEWVNMWQYLWRALMFEMFFNLFDKVLCLEWIHNCYIYLKRDSSIHGLFSWNLTWLLHIQNSLSKILQIVIDLYSNLSYPPPPPKKKIKIKIYLNNLQSGFFHENWNIGSMFQRRVPYL